MALKFGNPEAILKAITIYTSGCDNQPLYRIHINAYPCVYYAIINLAVHKIVEAMHTVYAKMGA